MRSRAIAPFVGRHEHPGAHLFCSGFGRYLLQKWLFGWLILSMLDVGVTTSLVGIFFSCLLLLQLLLLSSVPLVHSNIHLVVGIPSIGFQFLWGFRILEPGDFGQFSYHSIEIGSFVACGYTHEVIETNLEDEKNDNGVVHPNHHCRFRIFAILMFEHWENDCKVSIGKSSDDDQCKGNKHRTQYKNCFFDKHSPDMYQCFNTISWKIKALSAYYKGSAIQRIGGL